MASVIQGHRNPFGKSLTDYTVPELDFVLEMAARDEPERFTFTRAGTASVRQPEALARWQDTLAGPLRMRFLGRFGLTRQIEAVRAWKTRQAPGLRPGLSRGGKEIGGARNTD